MCETKAEFAERTSIFKHFFYRDMEKMGTSTFTNCLKSSQALNPEKRFLGLDAKEYHGFHLFFRSLQQSTTRT